MKMIEEKMISTKAALSEATKGLKKQQELIETTELEIEDLRKEKKTLEDSVEACGKTLRAMQKELDAMDQGKGGVLEKQAAYEASKLRLEKKKVQTQTHTTIFWAQFIIYGCFA